MKQYWFRRPLCICYSLYCHCLFIWFNKIWFVSGCKLLMADVRHTGDEWATGHQYIKHQSHCLRPSARIPVWDTASFVPDSPHTERNINKKANRLDRTPFFFICFLWRFSRQESAAAMSQRRAEGSRLDLRPLISVTH